MDFIEKLPGVGNIGIWGRSMGAATTLLYAHSDPRVKAICVDSPFERFEKLAEELVKKQINLPSFLIAGALKIIKSTVKSKNGLDISKLNPIEKVEKTFQPAIFVHAINDELINVEHSINLFNNYGGPKSLKCCDTGGHNTKRPKIVRNEIGEFFKKYLCGNGCDDTSDDLIKKYFNKNDNIDNNINNYDNNYDYENEELEEEDDDDDIYQDYDIYEQDLIMNQIIENHKKEMKNNNISNNDNKNNMNKIKKSKDNKNNSEEKRIEKIIQEEKNQMEQLKKTLINLQLDSNNDVNNMNNIELENDNNNIINNGNDDFINEEEEYKNNSGNDIHFENGGKFG